MLLYLEYTQLVAILVAGLMIGLATERRGFYVYGILGLAAGVLHSLYIIDVDFMVVDILLGFSAIRFGQSIRVVGLTGGVASGKVGAFYALPPFSSPSCVVFCRFMDLVLLYSHHKLDDSLQKACTLVQRVHHRC